MLSPLHICTIKLNVEGNVAHGYRVDTEKLKRAREDAGLTITELALKSGVDAYHLALVESQAYVPSLTALRSVAYALEMQTHSVIEWETGPLPWERQEHSA